MLVAQMGYSYELARLVNNTRFQSIATGYHFIIVEIDND